MVMYVSALLSQSYPLLPLLCPKVCSLRLHLDSCPANELIGTIFLDSTCVCVYIYIYMLIFNIYGASLIAQLVKNLPAVINLGSIPRMGRSPGERKG